MKCRSLSVRPNSSRAAGSFERPNPATTPIDDGGVNHLARAELWVLNWLEDAGYAVDVYTDYDFHPGISNFKDYKALILSTHPEYWTLEMMDELEAYLELRGRQWSDSLPFSVWTSFVFATAGL